MPRANQKHDEHSESEYKTAKQLLTHEFHGC
jgi:hypothetical protein